jgi:hypothetical protein
LYAIVPYSFKVISSFSILPNLYCISSQQMVMKYNPACDEFADCILANRASFTLPSPHF